MMSDFDDASMSEMMSLCLNFDDFLENKDLNFTYCSYTYILYLQYLENKDFTFINDSYKYIK